MQLSENVAVTKRWQETSTWQRESMDWGSECEQGAPHGSFGNSSFRGSGHCPVSE